MGINRYVYVGPFIKVPHVLKDDKNFNVVCSSSCGNQGLTVHMRFCSHCGAAAKRLPKGQPYLQALMLSDVDLAAELKNFEARIASMLHTLQRTLCVTPTLHFGVVAYWS